MRHYLPDRFEKYSHYFFFVHIDPVVRFWHWVGMFIGCYYFVRLAQNWRVWPVNISTYIVGLFFFYGFGFISHCLYGGQPAKRKVHFPLDTFPTVIWFNLLTATGLYQRELRNFIKKYPFIVEAYDLKSSSRPKQAFENPKVTN